MANNQNMSKENTTSISAILITKNEAHNIRACLQSIDWVDEIIIVDSGSSDATVDIAKEFTDKVYLETDWQGFGVQKNRALNYATSEWVISIDADERVTEQLKVEITSLISNPAFGSSLNSNMALAIPRRSHFCGKAMQHSGWWPDYVLRVFPREKGKFSNDLVHEKVLFNGAIKQLESPLIHYTYETLDQAMEKMNRYSSAWVDNQPADKNTSVMSAVLHGFWAFIRAYFLRRGFLDGAEGFALAVSNAEGSYYKYMKLYFLRKHQQMPKID